MFLQAVSRQACKLPYSSHGVACPANDDLRVVSEAGTPQFGNPPCCHRPSRRRLTAFQSSIDPVIMP